MSEQIEHNCGVVLVARYRDDEGDEKDWSQNFHCVEIAAKIARHLQHRGELGAGVSWLSKSKVSGERFHSVKKNGRVSHVIRNYAAQFAQVLSELVLAHTRYATSGPADEAMLQPRHHKDKRHRKEFIFGFNGNEPDYSKQRAALKNRGLRPTLPGDTEIIGLTLVDAFRQKGRRGLMEICKELGVFEGSFNLVLATGDGRAAALRDPYGRHPLVYAKHGPFVIVASEDSAIRRAIPSIENIQDIPPGYIIDIEREKNRCELARCLDEEGMVDPRSCFFERVYFANVDSTFDGFSVADTRYKTGEYLALNDADMEEPSDMVVAVPASAELAAIGYADFSGIPFVPAIQKNHGVGRTFTSPKNREQKALAKYRIDGDKIAGKSITLVDDSLVRGTTMRVLIKMLRQKGARKIHLRLASPPILAPCFYGIDFPTVSELLVRKYSDGSLQEGGVLPPEVLAAIAKDLGVDSIKYLPFSQLADVMGKPLKQLCTSCVDGEYATEGVQQLYEIENLNTSQKKDHKQMHACPSSVSSRKPCTEQRHPHHNKKRRNKIRQ